MTRTRTLIVVGCCMLVLTVLAALELRTETTQENRGQSFTGTLSRTPGEPAPPAPLPDAAPVTPHEAPQPSGANGALLPLDNGTLRPLPEFSPRPYAEPGLVSAPEAPALPGPGPDRPAPAAPLVTAPLTPHSAPATPQDDTASLVDKPEPADRPEPETRIPAELPSEKLPPVAEKPADLPAGKQTAPTTEPPAQETSADPAPTQKPAEQAQRPQTSKPAAAPQKTGKSRILTTAAPEKLLPGQKAVVWTHLELTGSEIIFRLTGAQDMKGKDFQLSSPERYVVDLDGDWGISLPKIPANPLLNAIRAGRQGDNTRLVFDLKKAPADCRIVRSNPKTLEIRLR